MNYIEQARKLRPIVEQAASSLDDQTASTAASLFPRLKEDGSLVSAGARINWNGTIKKAAVDLWDTAENNPDNAPSLWQDIEYKDGYCGVADCIFGEYVNPEGIEVYIADEVFYEAVKHSYKKIDLTGRRKRDMERFIAKRDKTAAWLRQKAKGIYF